MWNFALHNTELHPMGYGQCFLWVLGFFLVMPVVAYAIGRLARQEMPTPLEIVEHWITGWCTAIGMMIGLSVTLVTVSPAIAAVIFLLLGLAAAHGANGGMALRALLVTLAPIAVLLVYGGLTKAFNTARHLRKQLHLVSL
ncbi:MAG: hypothetical protein V1778_01665 [bacterium]